MPRITRLRETVPFGDPGPLERATRSEQVSTPADGPVCHERVFLQGRSVAPSRRALPGLASLRGQELRDRSILDRLLALKGEGAKRQGTA